MRTFTCRLQALSQQWQSEGALMFIARDPSGSFALQARHETLVTCLRPGLARLRLHDESCLYIAQPGAIVVFKNNVLRLSTTQFILSEDREQLLARMEQAWQTADRGVQTTKAGYLQVEQALTRKLWEMHHRGEGYAPL